jgi:membrane associated rhomboid family serine protease
MPPVTLNLIIANVVCFGLQSMAFETVVANFALWPLGSYPVGGSDLVVGFQPWQLLTYGFLHGNTQHLLFNMFGLFMFGRDVEDELGWKRYLAMYTVAVLCAGVVQLIVMSNADQISHTVGASGGVFGVLLAFAMLFPRRRVMLLIPPIPMPAWLLVLGYGVIELVSGVAGTSAGVAHFAHLGGMLGAFLALRRRPRGPRRIDPRY